MDQWPRIGRDGTGTAHLLSSGAPPSQRRRNTGLDDTPAAREITPSGDSRAAVRPETSRRTPYATAEPEEEQQQQDLTYNVGRDRERILELVAGPGLEFVGADVLNMLGPIVYLFSREGRPLYVGMSRRGLSRPFTHLHSALRKITETDRLQIWPVATPRAAVELEQHLIHHLMPVWNITGRAVALAWRLGKNPKSRTHQTVYPPLSLPFSTDERERRRLQRRSRRPVARNEARP
jgi:hypothetical protein